VVVGNDIQVVSEFVQERYILVESFWIDKVFGGLVLICSQYFVSERVNLRLESIPLLVRLDDLGIFGDELSFPLDHLLNMLLSPFFLKAKVR
jgi:lipid-A-disaccharide synthase-like uncharacterized protein